MPRLACILMSLLLAASLIGPSARAQKSKEKLDAAKAKVKSRALTEKNNGQKISLTKDDTFTITLDANATTGYWWSVVRINPELVVLQGKPAYKPYPAAPGIVGSGGQKIFTFKAVEVGSLEMELVYRTNPARDPKPARTFTLDIEVKE